MKKITKFVDWTTARLTAAAKTLLQYAYKPVSLWQLAFIALIVFLFCFSVTQLMFPFEWEVHIFLLACICCVLVNTFFLAERNHERFLFRPVDALFYAEESCKMLLNMFSVFLAMMKASRRFWVVLIVLFFLKTSAPGWFLDHVYDNILSTEDKLAILNTVRYLFSLGEFSAIVVVVSTLLYAMWVIMRQKYAADPFAISAIIDELKAENIPVPYKHEGSYCKLDVEKLLNQLANKEIQPNRAEALYWMIKNNYDACSSGSISPIQNLSRSLMKSTRPAFVH